MNGWFVLLGMLGAGAFYCMGRRSGYMHAERKYLLLQEKENAKMDEILQHYAHLGRNELLEQLRHHAPR